MFWCVCLMYFGKGGVVMGVGVGVDGVVGGRLFGYGYVCGFRGWL